MQKTINGFRYVNLFLSALPVLTTDWNRSLLSSMNDFRFRQATKLLRIMRMLTFFLFAAFLTVQASGVSQTVSLSVKKAALSDIFVAIKQQTGYSVAAPAHLLTNTRPVSVSVANLSLDSFLTIILKDQPLLYRIDDRTIFLSKKSKNPGIAGPDAASFLEEVIDAVTKDIIGRIVDSLGQPIIGASIQLTPGNRGSSSVANGFFKISSVRPGNYVLEISFVGHESVTKKIVVTDTATLDLGTIQMRVVNVALDAVEIVSTGMFDRNMQTFTGVTHTISGKELRAASRTNILEALHLLDPSFKIIRDNNMGSDPNQLPKVEIRGNRSLPPPTDPGFSQQLKLQYEHDPNQPLFILDGFETNLATVVNLDMNRVEDITLLVDAASTALYGSRSANGVVVIKTIPPVPGKLQVNYTVTGVLAMPDLSGYNMMNSAELLKFQELASMGEKAQGPFTENIENLLIPKLKHDFRNNAVVNGVNENWMEVPLRYAGDLKHALSVFGGDKYFRYNIGLTRATTQGVMKGSENSNNSGYAHLTYSNGKINISNNVTIGGTKQKGSPYGEFSQYVKTPPYYIINTTDRYLEDQFATYLGRYDFPKPNDYQYANPLYNAMLPYKNEITGLSITNNLMADWDVLPFLRLSTALQYATSNSHADYFIAPLNTQFDKVPTSEKGSYDYATSNDENYSAALTATFSKVMAQKHSVTMNLRGDLMHQTNNSQSISAVGFATTSEPLIYLASSYTPHSRPAGATTQQRSMRLTASLNYAYDLRYSIDLSYNLSGASNFGSDNLFQSFYSVGARWNIGRESFLQNATFINDLSISANLGLTGNENAGNFGSRSTYSLSTLPTIFGAAVKLETVGNPQLDWTRTYNYSFQVKGRFLNRLSTSLRAYRQLTDPMIINMPRPASVGVESLPKNIGKLTSSGLELMLDAKIIQTRDWTLNIGLNTPLYYKSEYSGIGNTLQKYTDSARNNNYTQRYYDGTGPDDIWAVRSLGIGQAKGVEVFLDKSGNYTFDFDILNEMPVGTKRPVSQGNLNINVRYKKIAIGIYTRYIIEEMKFNTALYNKVENITKADLENNQDKRALYLRWQKPGDQASFVGIANTRLGMSSRFLQKETALEVSGINFSFDVFNQYSKGITQYVRTKFGFQALNFSVNTSNIFEFRLSNVKIEKGLYYPFQRSVSLTMNLTF